MIHRGIPFYFYKTKIVFIFIFKIFQLLKTKQKKNVYKSNV